MRRTLAVLLCLALSSWAGKKTNAPRPGEHCRYAPTWEAAVAEARALNLPIVIHRHGFYWSPCWSLHRSVLTNRKYIRFSRENCVEVMCMKDIDRALAEKPARAATYKAKDAWGDEIECFVNFPGVTIDQMKRMHEGEALNYMQGPLMPYTAVVDPHTLKDLFGIKRGETTSAQGFIEVIGKHVKALKAEHGPGIDRKLWDFVLESQVKVDLLLAEEEYLDAVALLKEMEKRSARQPDVLLRKVGATRDSVTEDLKKRVETLRAENDKKKRRELEKLEKALAEYKN